VSACNHRAAFFNCVGFYSWYCVASGDAAAACYAVLCCAVLCKLCGV
jgi:hypothetical protein